MSQNQLFAIAEAIIYKAVGPNDLFNEPELRAKLKKGGTPLIENLRPAREIVPSGLQESLDICDLLAIALIRKVHCQEALKAGSPNGVYLLKIRDLHACEYAVLNAAQASPVF